MNQKLKRASAKLFASRLLRFAGGVGVIVTTLGATYELGEKVFAASELPAPEVREAQRYIDKYVNELDEALLNVVLVVRQVHKRSLADGPPPDCPREKTDWPEACKVFRKHWEQDLVATMEKEAAHDTLRLAQFFYQIDRCVETELCDESTIRDYFDTEICRFWQQTSPYIIHEADQNTADAQWLEGFCDGDGGRCNTIAA